MPAGDYRARLVANNAGDGAGLDDLRAKLRQRKTHQHGRKSQQANVKSLLPLAAGCCACSIGRQC
jgi:hypothetical protein